MRRHLATLLVILAVGAPQRRAGAQSRPDVLVVRRPSYPDSAGVANGIGSARIAVRAVDRPTEAIPDARLTLFDPAGRQLRRAMSDAKGLARLDTLRAATYRLLVQRIGYRSLDLAVPVSAGCSTDIELYLTQEYIGLEAVVVAPSRDSAVTPAAPGTIVVTAPRSTVTLCEPAPVGR